MMSAKAQAIVRLNEAPLLPIEPHTQQVSEHGNMLSMTQISRKKFIELLSRAEQLAPTDPEAALAAQMFRSALEPPKPRDLLREELRGKLGEYAFSILMDDAQAAGLLANDIRKCLASQGLEPPSFN